MTRGTIQRFPLPMAETDHHDTVCACSLTAGLLIIRAIEGDFEIGVGLAEGLGQPRQPILAVDGLAGVGMRFEGKNSRRGRDLGAGYPAANGTGGHGNAGIVANPLGLAHLAEGHYVKLVVLFAEPYWGCDLHSGFAKGGQRNVFLAVNRSWDGGRHKKWLSQRPVF